MMSNIHNNRSFSVYQMAIEGKICMVVFTLKELNKHFFLKKQEIQLVH